MKILFANVTQGFVYSTDTGKPESMNFRRFSIPEYAEFFAQQDQDILCLSEVLMDDIEGKSIMTETISHATRLPHFKTLRSEESWIYIGKHYGMAIISKFPLEKYEKVLLPNPKFEATRDDGDHWVMHNKYAQYARLNIEGIPLNLFSLHYFPVHHFKKKMSGIEMKPYRESLIETFRSKGFETPTIIAGDFNDKETTLKKAFPELFSTGELATALTVETTLVDGDDQLDHILYTKKHFKVQSAEAKPFLSDHYYVTGNLSFI